jgi:hypothetical protein
MVKLMDVLSKAKLTATTAAATSCKTKAKHDAEKHKAWIEKCRNATKCKHCKKSIQTVPKLNSGNSRKMQPNGLLTGSPPSQVDGARDLQ